jgi:hypothetical protein
MARKPFGGMTIDLACDCTMADVFGKKMMPSEMTKKLWAHIRKHGHMNK